MEGLEADMVVGGQREDRKGTKLGSFYKLGNNLIFQVMRSGFAREPPGPYLHFAVPRMIGLWVY